MNQNERWASLVTQLKVRGEWLVWSTWLRKPCEEILLLGKLRVFKIFDSLVPPSTIIRGEQDGLDMAYSEVSMNHKQSWGRFLWNYCFHSQGRTSLATTFYFQTGLYHPSYPTFHSTNRFAFDFHNYLASEDASHFPYSSPFYFHTEILSPF